MPSDTECMPTRFPGLIVDTIFLQQLIRIIEHTNRRIKADAMLCPIGPFFCFVPLELHGVIRVYNSDLSATRAALPPSGTLRVP